MYAVYLTDHTQYKKAEPALRRALAIAPLDALGYTYLGMVCSLQGNFSEADLHLRKATELAGPNPDAKTSEAIQNVLIELGFAESRAGQSAQGEVHFLLAGTLVTDPVRRYRNLWLPLFGSGFFELAFRFFRLNRQAQAEACKHFERQAGVRRRFLRDTWSIQIGHLAHLDGYMKIGLLGWRPPQETILLATSDKISNRAFLDCWKGFVTPISRPEEIASRADEALVCEDYLPIHEIQGMAMWALVAAAKAQKQWDLEKRGPLLKLDPELRRRGREALKKLGVPDGAWIVGVHVRDSGFHGKIDGAVQRYRNASIESYFPAMESIVRRGGYVIRMGDPKMTRLPAMPGVIDYAHCDMKSDWLDVFLCAYSRFYIGTQSGLSQVPNCFGVPTIYTNWVSLAIPPWYQENLFLPKLFHWKATGRSLSFLEILNKGISFMQTAQLDEHGIQWRDNTPAEIRDVIEEMMDRLDGRSADDSAHQQAQWAALAEANGVVVNARMGRKFLAEHFALFEPQPGDVKLQALQTVFPAA
jgi:putative glycosyltransferase (TIGR04372 family)